MASRRRTDKQRLQLTGEVEQLLDWGRLCQLVDHFGSEEAARQAWRRFARQLLDKQLHLGHRPAAYWLFEPGVPDELREYALWTHWGDEHDSRAAVEQQRIDRVEWLAAHGRLTDREVDELLSPGGHLGAELAEAVRRGRARRGEVVG